MTHHTLARLFKRKKQQKSSGSPYRDKPPAVPVRRASFKQMLSFFAERIRRAAMEIAMAVLVEAVRKMM